MSTKRNNYKNATVKTVFKTIESELLGRTIFQTQQQTQNAIGQYIETVYNSKSRYSALGYRSPIQFELQILSLGV